MSVLWYITNAIFPIEAVIMDYEYTKKSSIGGISKNKRELLDFLNRELTGPFRISDVMKLLNIPYTARLDTLFGISSLTTRKFLQA